MRAAKQIFTAQRQAQLDPLYVIFEQHLYNFQDSDTDRKSFIVGVVQDYLTHLRRMEISIPKTLEDPIIEELGTLVNTMLVKKIYGCLTIQDYRKKAPPTVRKQARSKYIRMTGKK
jgi:hypothetical protein